MASVRNPRVMHVVPDSIHDPRHFHIGSTKDIRGRTEYFEDRGIPVDEVVAEGRSDKRLLEVLKRTPLEPYTAAFLEYPIYPRSMRHLRKAAPQMTLITRGSNAELYHRLHLVEANRRSGSPGRALTSLRESVVRLYQDRTCARLADFVASITEWERTDYWRRIAPSERAETVPYFLPRRYRSAPPALDKKKLQCLCLMSTAINPLLVDAARCFASDVRDLGERRPEWRFLMTGEVSERDVSLPPRVQRTGLVDSPFDLLAESRALAMLSSLGFGFKTKLLDAVHYGCYVLVPHKLYERLPSEVQPWCITVGEGGGVSFEEALGRCEAPFPAGDPNEALRAQAFTSMDLMLGLAD